MGCGSSKITLVQPVLSSPDPNEEDTGKQCVDVDRGDSAVSKFTTDSGVGLDSGEAPTLPGAVHRKLPPLAGFSPGLPQETQRPRSSDIMEQLLSQGIIPAHPRDRACKTGEAYNIMLDKPEMPRTSPPSRLESLKMRKDQMGTSREEMEEKMRQLKEEELRLRLRSKSARARGLASAEVGGETGLTPVETLQNRLPDTLPWSGDPEDLQGPLLQAHTESMEAGEGSREAGESGREAGEGSREAGEGSREAGEGSREAGGGEGQGDKVSEGARFGDLLTASLQMESDFTFQQTGQAEQDLF
ncbi:stathmin domain-containing protein 1 isoform X2 [Hypomesus transpacificus]|uniref:stathmin domain-containing protein 1 isoform X2 n=1 Tax=Hypomesus transpacificus TaxID=137520 RepID=UPI001F07F3E6|nr:stathmin domain-containing protein 1 isoform X2 [Hypomesus transpacificus]